MASTVSLNEITDGSHLDGISLGVCQCCCKAMRDDSKSYWRTKILRPGNMRSVHFLGHQEMVGRLLGSSSSKLDWNLLGGRRESQELTGVGGATSFDRPGY
jgi:hypothetical protein